MASASPTTNINSQNIQQGQLLFEIRHSQIHHPYAIAHIGDVILVLNGGGDDSEIGISIDLATEQMVDQWAPSSTIKNGSTIGFHWAHDITTSQDGRSFYVAQLLGAGGNNKNNNQYNNKKIFKFDLTESYRTI